jgi:thiosulfate dehydrogenase (quinone) large subunit
MDLAWHRTVLRELRALRQPILDDLRSDHASLLPVRLFIGIGWLRACSEKAVDSDWWTGDTLRTFLSGQLDRDAVPFPFYRAIIEQQFLPSATALSWIIVLGQLMAGVAIAGGIFTNAALLAGLFMNLNFVMAGEPTPSAFYIVIQITLLVMNAGAIVGADARLCRRWRSPWLTARSVRECEPHRVGRTSFALITLLSALSVCFCLLHVRDWSPGGSVHDPAMILAVSGVMIAFWCGVGAVQRRHQIMSAKSEVEPIPDLGSGGQRPIGRWHQAPVS